LVDSNTCVREKTKDFPKTLVESKERVLLNCAVVLSLPDTDIKRELVKRIEFAKALDLLSVTVFPKTRDLEKLLDPLNERELVILLLCANPREKLKKEVEANEELPLKNEDLDKDRDRLQFLDLLNDCDCVIDLELEKKCDLEKKELFGKSFDCPNIRLPDMGNVVDICLVIENERVALNDLVDLNLAE
jgi:hypothetical protein